MRVIAFAAAAALIIASASALVLERRVYTDDIPASVQGLDLSTAAPHRYAHRGTTPADQIVPLTFAVRQNLEKLEETVMAVSDPE